ncbi:hypothetical protein [Streptacidiphilus sp. EB129]|uniref:hypothetical protein n=1 Tax=Streptacidiphilus sp. EB129 TaxID=3156262 RepID=UPI003518ADAA
MNAVAAPEAAPVRRPSLVELAERPLPVAVRERVLPTKGQPVPVASFQSSV